MSAETLKVEPIASYVTPPATLVTARSYLIDRYVPDCEVVALPQKEVVGGELAFGRGALTALPDTRGRMAQMRKPRVKRVVKEPNVIDLRRNYPQNWAHFMNNHLPILFHIARELNCAPDQFLAVLPVETPAYIRAAAAFFGVPTLETDDIIEADGFVYDAQPWSGIRPARAQWVRQSQYAQDKLAQLDAQGGESPARVFLARRDTRTIENASEVTDFLKARGFVTVYPEELSIAQQIRLFRKAEIMVAIHGAGLAPLLYSQPGGNLRQLIEILPCGLMTDVFRVMASQVGCPWIGVRGQIKPAYIESAYNFSAPMVEFSFDSFHVDIASLEQAFSLADVSG